MGHRDPDLNLRLPPHSIEAEQSLIGGLLLDNTAWDRIADMVSEADFYRDDHRRIFSHIRKLVETGRPADVVTIYESIEKANEVDQTGGLAYLGEIANATPSAANIRRYAEIVHERAVLRKLISIGDEIAASALNPAGRDAKMLLDAAEQKVFEIASIAGHSRHSGLRPANTALAAWISEIEDIQEGRRASGLPTGFPSLDRALAGGLRPGNLIIVAGRPSMGKTAFALNIAEHIGMDLAKPVAIFSMEMSTVEILTRIACARQSIRSQLLTQAGGLDDDGFGQVADAMRDLDQAAISIDDQGGLTPGLLRTRARRLATTVPLVAIVVDYLQLMSGDGGDENRQQEITSITRSLKALAKELGVPVVALSQLSRKVEERSDKRPLMSDLRESGAIEQDADLILMMYREEYYKPDTADKGIAEVIIGKQRNGPTGTIRLAWQAEFARFKDLGSVPVVRGPQPVARPISGRREVLDDTGYNQFGLRQGN